MDKKLLFILNPTAGINRTFAPLIEALSVFSKNSYFINLRTTTKAGDATNFVLNYGQGMDLIVCCGGDGTLNETMSGLMQLPIKPLLGYLPRGSTNDFASSLSISDDPVDAVCSMLCHEPRLLDAGLFNGRSFIYVASFGAFTKTSYSTPQAIKNVLGHFAYILEGIKDLSSLRPHSVCVTADGECLDGDYLFGAVCNSTSIAGLMRLSNDVVVLDDGLFELLLIPKPQSITHLQGMILALVTQHLTSPDLIFRQVSHVHVRTEIDLPWALDGEYAPSAPSVDIVNHRQGIRMVL